MTHIQLWRYYVYGLNLIIMNIFPEQEIVGVSPRKRLLELFRMIVES